MSTRYDTIGIMLASGNGTLSDGTPRVLAQIGGKSLLQRAIDAHLAAFGRAMVVINAAQGRKIRETIGAKNNGLVWCVQSDECAEKEALKCVLFELHCQDIHPDNVVISMGNAGLWRPETLRAVRNVHRATRTERSSVMTLATVRWNTYPEAFWNHGVTGYSGPDEPLPYSLKEVREYWHYGHGRNGQPGTSSGDVSAKLFCFDFVWLLDCVERYLAQYQGQGLNFSPHCFLHSLISVAYGQRKPVALFRLPDKQAHEALCIRRDYDLEYVREKLQALSPTDNMPDAAMRFATEYIAVARAV